MLNGETKKENVKCLCSVWGFLVCHSRMYPRQLLGTIVQLSVLYCQKQLQYGFLLLLCTFCVASQSYWLILALKMRYFWSRQSGLVGSLKTREMGRGETPQLKSSLWRPITSGTEPPRTVCTLCGIRQAEGILKNLTLCNSCTARQCLWRTSWNLIITLWSRS